MAEPTIAVRARKPRRVVTFSRIFVEVSTSQALTADSPAGQRPQIAGSGVREEPSDQESLDRETLRTSQGTESRASAGYPTVRETIPRPSVPKLGRRSQKER